MVADRLITVKIRLARRSQRCLRRCRRQSHPAARHWPCRNRRKHRRSFRNDRQGIRRNRDGGRFGGRARHGRHGGVGGNSGQAGGGTAGGEGGGGGGGGGVGVAWARPHTPSEERE